MSYAKKGNLRKCLPDIIKLKWQDKLQLLEKIILGLEVIHGSNLAHGDLHDGNILMSDNHNEVFIIDLGLCKPIQDSDIEVNENYGVLPYMAPELLRNNPYTPASDIYSFSIIMWEFTSGVPPFKHKAHDLQLSLSICEGERPKIIKNTPKCYRDLMEECWDSNPSNRPTIIELKNKISEWIKCINEYYEKNRDGNYNYGVNTIDNKLKNDIFEFVEADNTLVQEDNNISQTNNALAHEQANISIIQSHSQACYTSRKLTRFSECLECMI
jgi:serine/threonine protein kinase